MIGRFVIWVEDEFGHIYKAMTWTGRAFEGIEKAKTDARLRGLNRIDVWATPVANSN